METRKNANTDDQLSELNVQSPQESSCNYDLGDNQWFATQRENSNFEVRSSQLNVGFDHHSNNSETANSSIPSSDFYYSHQEFLSNCDARKNNQNDIMKVHYNTKVTQAKVLNGLRDNQFHSKQLDETSCKGSSHKQMTTCITDTATKEKKISKHEEKKVRLVNSLGNSKATKKRKRNNNNRKTSNGIQQVPLKFEENFIDVDCIKDDGISHEKMVNNSIEVHGDSLSADFNIHNSNNQNEIFNISNEGYKYLSEQDFAHSPQPKSKYFLNKTSTIEIGNYDPCNMIDDEPDSDEYPPKNNPKSSEQLDDQKKEMNKKAVLNNEDKLNLSNSSFFSQDNYSPHRNVQFLKL